MAPLRDAQVTLLGTEHRTVTDSGGTYRLDGVRQGRYRLTLAHPRIDAVGAVPPVREVAVLPGEQVVADFVVPTAELVLRRLCPEQRPDARIGALRGFVLDSSRHPVPDAAVTVSWKRRVAGPEGWSVEPYSVATSTDSLGHYRVCEIPGGVTLRIEAELQRFDRRVELRVPPGSVRRHDVQLEAKQREEGEIGEQR